MVDARGLSCPMPVVMVQKQIKAEKPDKLTVAVDNRCAVDNVTRFAQNNGYAVEVVADGSDFRLELTREK